MLYPIFQCLCVKCVPSTSMACPYWFIPSPSIIDSTSMRILQRNRVTELDILILRQWDPFFRDFNSRSKGIWVLDWIVIRKLEELEQFAYKQTDLSCMEWEWKGSHWLQKKSGEDAVLTYVNRRLVYAQCISIHMMWIP